MTGYTATALGELVQRDGALVNGRIYTDPEIFGLEMERIFSKAWVYVGHESQVANPGDYMTGYLAQQPIILTRDRAGDPRSKPGGMSANGKGLSDCSLSP
ncbi:hypothetical protein [Bordetella bronchiseptica]|uniref:hypothetical protein n=2 Tax=Bordetella bronchiseptica TaxID=518 RepID=UPI0004615810|nr:hypothetical protein [Bordetella bronchiseptica]KDC61187.1 hypothetical protein L510_4246 [Bordetella bronchiseptica MBORD591]